MPSKMPETHRHFILHKPYGYISQFVTDAKRKKVLGELHDFPQGTMAIGRLDEDSEGLLLLTTDGMESENIRGRHVSKEYYVQLDGDINEQGLNHLREGVEIGIRDVKYTTLPCEVRKIPKPDFPERSRKVRDDRHGPTSWISITITEGKNRQVRKMTAAAGFPTLRLVRVRIGTLQLGEFEPGKVIEVQSFLV